MKDWILIYYCDYDFTDFITNHNNKTNHQQVVILELLRISINSFNKITKNILFLSKNSMELSIIQILEKEFDIKIIQTESIFSEIEKILQTMNVILITEKYFYYLDPSNKINFNESDKIGCQLKNTFDTLFLKKIKEKINVDKFVDFAISIIPSNTRTISIMHYLADQDLKLHNQNMDDRLVIIGMLLYKKFSYFLENIDMTHFITFKNEKEMNIIHDVINKTALNVNAYLTGKRLDWTAKNPSKNILDFFNINLDNKLTFSDERYIYYQYMNINKAMEIMDEGNIMKTDGYGTNETFLYSDLFIESYSPNTGIFIKKIYSNESIEKNLNLIWFLNREIYNSHINTWKKAYKGFNFNIWDNQSLNTFIKNNRWNNLLQKCDDSERVSLYPSQIILLMSVMEEYGGIFIVDICYPLKQFTEKILKTNFSLSINNEKRSKMKLSFKIILAKRQSFVFNSIFDELNQYEIITEEIINEVILRTENITIYPSYYLNASISCCPKRLENLCYATSVNLK